MAKKAKKMTARQKHLKRVSQYKELTGKKRISKYEREALKFMMPKTLSKREASDSLWKKRIDSYVKTYGEEPSESAKALLKYNSLGVSAKKLNIKKETVELPIPFLEDIKLGSIRYDNFPREIKRWNHKKGNWLYVTGAFHNVPMDLDYMLNTENAYNGDSARDHNNEDFIDVIMKHKFVHLEIETMPSGYKRVKRK